MQVVRAQIERAFRTSEIEALVLSEFADGVFAVMAAPFLARLPGGDEPDLIRTLSGPQHTRARFDGAARNHRQSTWAQGGELREALARSISDHHHGVNPGEFAGVQAAGVNGDQ